MANDNIFQQYLTPPKSVMDYTAEMDQADARKNALQMSALNLQQGKMNLANAADIGNQRNALRAAVTSGQIDLTNPQHANAALMLAPDVAPGMLKTVQDGAAAQAATAASNQKTADGNFDLKIKKADQAIKDISGFGSPQEALTSLQQHVAAGDVDPVKGKMIADSLTTMAPGDFPKWQLGMVKNIMSAKEQMQYAAPDANTVANNARIAAEGAANRSNQISVQNMIGARQDKSDAAEGAANSVFTPAAITNAAARYNLDGTLPPMGMGKSGSAGRAAILNEAAQLANGIDPTDQRRNQLGAKGEASAKAASLRAYGAAGSEGKALQATNTGLNHLDTVEQLAIAQKNGNIQLFNTIANKLAAETGKPAPTNLAAAISMVAPEVSKAVIGAAGGQEERAKFAANFNPNASPQSALEGIGIIKDLMGGRLTEAQRTYERTVGKKDFRETMLSPAAQRVLDKAHGSTAAPASAASTAKPSLSDIFGATP